MFFSFYTSSLAISSIVEKCFKFGLPCLFSVCPFSNSFNNLNFTCIWYMLLRCTTAFLIFIMRTEEFIFCLYGYIMAQLEISCNAIYRCYSIFEIFELIYVPVVYQKKLTVQYGLHGMIYSSFKKPHKNIHYTTAYELYLQDVCF